MCPTLGRRVRWLDERLNVTDTRTLAYDADTGVLLFISQDFTPDVAFCCGFVPPGDSDEYGVAPRCVGRLERPAK